MRRRSRFASAFKLYEQQYRRRRTEDERTSSRNVMREFEEDEMHISDCSEEDRGESKIVSECKEYGEVARKSRENSKIQGHASNIVPEVDENEMHISDCSEEDRNEYKILKEHRKYGSSAKKPRRRLKILGDSRNAAPEVEDEMHISDWSEEDHGENKTTDEHRKNDISEGISRKNSKILVHSRNVVADVDEDEMHISDCSEEDHGENKIVNERKDCDSSAINSRKRSQILIPSTNVGPKIDDYEIHISDFSDEDHDENKMVNEQRTYDILARKSRKMSKMFDLSRNVVPKADRDEMHISDCSDEDHDVKAEGSTTSVFNDSKRDQDETSRNSHENLGTRDPQFPQLKVSIDLSRISLKNIMCRRPDKVCNRNESADASVIESSEKTCIDSSQIKTPKSKSAEFVRLSPLSAKSTAFKQKGYRKNGFLDEFYKATKTSEMDSRFLKHDKRLGLREGTHVRVVKLIESFGVVFAEVRKETNTSINVNASPSDPNSNATHLIVIGNEHLNMVKQGSLLETFFTTDPYIINDEDGNEVIVQIQPKRIIILKQ